MLKIIQLFLLVFVALTAYGYDELTEVDPVVTSSYYTGKKWSYEFELSGSPWLKDDVRKVIFERKIIGWKNYCTSKNRRDDFRCKIKTKRDTSKIRVKIYVKNKREPIIVYFWAVMKDIEYLGSNPDFPKLKEL